MRFDGSKAKVGDVFVRERLFDEDGRPCGSVWIQVPSARGCMPKPLSAAAHGQTVEIGDDGR